VEHGARSPGGTATDTHGRRLFEEFLASDDGIWWLHAIALLFFGFCLFFGRGE